MRLPQAFRRATRRWLESAGFGSLEVNGSDLVWLGQFKDSPIVILDEATSAVDNETERAIQQNLAKITQGKTGLSSRIVFRRSAMRMKSGFLSREQSLNGVVMIRS